MLRKNLALLTVLALAAACLFSACTRKIFVAPKTTDLSTVTPTQTHTFTTTVTFSLTPTVTPTLTATLTPTQTPTPLGPIIITIAGNGSYTYSGDGGPATLAGLYGPSQMVFDASGNLYFASIYNYVIRKVDTNGIITTVAGNGTQGYTGDGGPATSAQLDSPYGVAVDPLGNVYIADTNNNVIRMVDTNGIITTMVGDGTQGYAGDGGPATSAKLYEPYGITLDTTGNLFIADLGNNVIRKVNTGGIISTVVGNGTDGYSGDGGPATAAQLKAPFGICFDSLGNLYIADFGINVIREVSTSGIITTVAGNGTSGYLGDGGPATLAELYGPAGVVVDSSGNLFIADDLNNRIRKVDTSGIITTVAGNGTGGFSGDGGPPTAAEIYGPLGVAIDSFGNLYIADYGNNRIRKIY